MEKKLIIGLCGPMASGKNLAAGILQNMGFACIDADLAGHQALENCRDLVLQAFKQDAEQANIPLVDGDGKIIRKNLGKIVFSSPEKLKKHEEIVHGEINRLMENFLQQNSSKNRVLNATVLYKVPLIHKCDFVIFITAPFLLRLYRARRRDKAKIKDLLKRFYAQKDLYAQYRSQNVDIYKVSNCLSAGHLQKKLNALLKNKV